MDLVIYFLMRNIDPGVTKFLGEP